MSKATVNIETVKIQKGNKFSQKNLTKASFNNYSNETIYIIHKGVDIALPKPNDVNGVPVPIGFVFDFGNETFDLDLGIRFPSGNGNLIIHFATKI